MYKDVKAAALSVRRVVLAFLLITGLAIPSNAFGTEIKVLCTQALTSAMANIWPQFERETGNKLVVIYSGTGGLLKRIKNGETADVIIVTASAVDNLAKQGKIVEQSRTAIAQTGVGIAIRRGAPRPDISSAEALNELFSPLSRSLTQTRPVAVQAGLFSHRL